MFDEVIGVGFEDVTLTGAGLLQRFRAWRVADNTFRVLGAQAADVRRMVMMSGLRWLVRWESESAYRRVSRSPRFSRIESGGSSQPIR